MSDLVPNTAAGQASGEPPEILFLDDHYVAVHKASGLLVHRTWLATAETFLLQQVRDRIGRHVYPVHRLDRATSGIIIFGLTPDAARRLQAAIESNAVTKRYRAVVRGWLTSEGILDHAVSDRDARRGAGGLPRPAVTAYRPLARIEIPEPVDRYSSARYGLVEARPLTGRRHQIRQHFKHLSHPIIGDTTYGKGSHNRFFRDRFGIARLLLVSWQLDFVHPFTQRPVRIHAAEDPEWQRLMTALDWVDVS